MVSGIGVRRGLSSESVVSTAEYPYIGTAGWWARVASTSTATTFRRAWPGLARCSATCRHQPSTDSKLRYKKARTVSACALAHCLSTIPQCRTVLSKAARRCTALHGRTQWPVLAAQPCVLGCVALWLCRHVACVACMSACSADSNCADPMQLS